VDHRIKILGTDYLSIQKFDDTPKTHIVLLSAGVRILEGIALKGVEDGGYTFYCLPLKHVGIDGSPVRAVLFPRGQSAPTHRESVTDIT